MDADRFDVVEAGVLTASMERWEQARARFAVLSKLMNESSIGTAVAEDAAQQLGVSQRQVYVLLSRLRNGEGRSLICWSLLLRVGAGTPACVPRWRK